MPSPGAVGRPFENLSATDSLEIKFVPKATIFTLKNEESRRPDDVMGAMLLRLEGAAGAASEEVQGIIELGSMALDPYKLEAIGMAWNMGQAIVHWDQTMAAIQRQADETANTYWESRLGLINPEDAYRKEGAFFFHVASNLTGGWVVKGAGKARLAGNVVDAAEFAAKAAKKPNRFLTGVKVTDRATGKVFEGTVDLKPTIDRINSCRPFPHRNDGGIFNNYPLPDRTVPELPVRPHGYYREFVHPTPGIAGPGPQRIVVGQGGEWYYTPQHYQKFIPLNP